MDNHDDDVLTKLTNPSIPLAPLCVSSFSCHSVMRYLDILFCYIYDFTILGGTVDGWGICGALLIIGSCMGSVFIHSQTK